MTMGVGAARSLGVSSAARFGLEGVGALFGLLTTTIVARHLGPIGKGSVSTLSYVVALIVPACAFGMGEATVALLGQRRTSLQEALSSLLALIGLAGLVGAVLVLPVSMALFGGYWVKIELPIALAGASVPLAALTGVLRLLVEARQRVVYSGLVWVVQTGVTAAATLVLVAGLDRWVVGALAAMLLGWIVAVAMLLGLVVRFDVSLRPAWNATFLRSALSYGVPVQLSYLVLVASTRVDLLLVNAISGRASSGRYSISLTVAQIVTYGPLSLLVAAFPRLAAMPAEEVPAWTERLCRLSLVASLAVAVPVGAAVRWLIPGVFGSGFHGAVVPTLILLPSAVAWSAQWSLCRSWAARGRTWLLPVSFGSSLVSMVVADVLLIPRFHETGAAWGALLSGISGMAVAVLPQVREPVNRVTLSGLVPRPRDVVELAQLTVRVARRFRAAT